MYIAGDTCWLLCLWLARGFVRVRSSLFQGDVMSEEFEKFLTERREMPENKKGSLSYAIWQAVCELKDKEIAALNDAAEKATSYVVYLSGNITEVINENTKLCSELDALKSQKPAIPEGYALVPVEPTDEMIIVGAESLNDEGVQHQDDLYCVEWQQNVVESIFKAMIAAAKKGGE